MTIHYMAHTIMEYMCRPVCVHVSAKCRDNWGADEHNFMAGAVDYHHLFEAGFGRRMDALLRVVDPGVSPLRAIRWGERSVDPSDKH